MLKPATLILILLIFALSARAEPSTDCERAKELDTRARALEPASARVAGYQEITTLCANFNYFYKLGRAQQQAGDAAGAKISYEKARALVGDTRAEGLLYGRLAEVSLALDKADEAVAIADVALALTQPDTPDWVHSVRKQADQRLSEQPITADRITRSLVTSRAFANRPSLGASRAFAVRPRIHLHILFDTGKDSLTKKGRAQVAELGKALSALPDNEVIQLLGHTDVGGFEFYTQRLSVMRAERVMDEVTAAYPKLAGRITATGRGDKEPRYSQASDQNNILNRRVEVALGK